MKKWEKIIETANTVPAYQILEQYRNDYIYDPRHLEVAELKWDRRFLDARVLIEEIEKDHQEYYQFAREKFNASF